MAKFKEGVQVVCIDSFDTLNRLTKNKFYTVLPNRTGNDNSRIIWICNDIGDIDFYVNWRFTSLIEYRKQIINEILDYADI